MGRPRDGCAQGELTVGDARRLHVPSLPERGGEVRLGPDPAKHARVLRLARGDRVVLFDGEGREAEGEVTRVEPGEVVCRVGSPRRAGPEGPRIGLGVAVPKAGKLDGIVRMATEAGASTVLLIATERTVGRLDGERAARRLQRLGRVAREAARQAGRAEVPEVGGPASLGDLDARMAADAARLLADPSAERAVSEVVQRPVSEAWVLVGPEGGFSPAERAWLVEHGYEGVRLAAHTLRTETAAPVAVALVADRLRALHPSR